MPCAVSSSVVTSAPCCCSARSSAEPVHARHDQVGDHDRRTERRDLLQRLLAVGGRFGDEAPALDQLFEADPRGGIVFDNQDAFGDRSGFACVNGDVIPSAVMRHSVTSTMSFLHSGRRARPMQAQHLQVFSTLTTSAGGGPLQSVHLGGEALMRLVTICIFALGIGCHRLRSRCHSGRQRARTAGQRAGSAGNGAPAAAATAGASPAQMRRPHERARLHLPPQPPRLRQRPPSREVTIPAGTELPVVLDTGVGSDTSRVEEAGARRISRARSSFDGETVLAAGHARQRRRDRRRRAPERSRAARTSPCASTRSTPRGDDERYESGPRRSHARRRRRRRRTRSRSARRRAGGAIIGAIVGGKKGAAIGTAAGGGAGHGRRAVHARQGSAPGRRGQR